MLPLSWIQLTLSLKLTCDFVITTSSIHLISRSSLNTAKQLVTLQNIYFLSLIKTMFVFLVFK